MSVASTSTSVDPWEHPLTASLTHRHVAPAQAVPDAWDDDEEEEEDQQAIWENANNKAPMPELVISASSTTTVVSPPPAAIQPTLRILKRPTGAQTPSSSASTSGSEQKSYAEREAQYQAARQRIFQDSSSNGAAAGVVDDAARARLAKSREGSSPSSPSGRDSSNPASVKIIRDPRGPNSSPDTASRPRSSACSSRRNQQGFQSNVGSGDRAA